MAIITVSEYQTITNETITGGDLSDAYIDFILESVSDDVEDYCDRKFGLQVVTSERGNAQAITYHDQPALRFQTRENPITAITALSVFYAVDADPTDLSIDDAVIESGQTSFLMPFGAFGIWQSFFTIGHSYIALADYSAGEAVPDNVKRAVALLAQEAFALGSASSTSGTDQVDSYRIGDYQEKKAGRNLDASGGLGLGTQNSVQAARSLAKWKQSGVMFL